MPLDGSVLLHNSCGVGASRSYNDLAVDDEAHNILFSETVEERYPRSYSKELVIELNNINGDPPLLLHRSNASFALYFLQNNTST